MDTGLEAWPTCTQCGGRSFEHRPFASDDIICLNCGYVSKAEDGERQPVEADDDAPRMANDEPA
jgi:hypothetical protein